MDSGVGISDSIVQSIFEPFFKGELSHTRARAGIGLGLAHARKFAKALGGDVELVQSNVGRGSTFEVKVASVLHT